MSGEPNAPISPRSPNAIKSFFSYLGVMPKLHKKLMAVAILLAGGGTVGQMSTYFADAGKATEQAVAPSAPNTPANSAVAQGSTPQPSAAPSTQPTVVERVSPVAQKLGLGFIAGFVIGWVFRTFIKIMSLITMGGVAIFAGLAYLGVDMSAMKTRFESGMGWVSEQGEELADKAMKRLPGSAAGVTGMFFGFKRKK